MRKIISIKTAMDIHREQSDSILRVLEILKPISEKWYKHNILEDIDLQAHLCKLYCERYSGRHIIEQFYDNSSIKNIVLSRMDELINIEMNKLARNML